MKIEIKKLSDYKSEYTILRDDDSKESIILETKTFFIHDICHYVVEKNLNFKKGFWGLLSVGHTFNELVGKDNPLTEELKFIERIVGPIQSVHLGYLPIQNFDESVKHLDIKISENNLIEILDNVKIILSDWQKLYIDDKLKLEWKLC